VENEKSFILQTLLSSLVPKLLTLNSSSTSSPAARVHAGIFNKTIFSANGKKRHQSLGNLGPENKAPGVAYSALPVRPNSLLD
jgi:hypothetical protein